MTAQTHPMQLDINCFKERIKMLLIIKTRKCLSRHSWLKRMPFTYSLLILIPEESNWKSSTEEKNNTKFAEKNS